MNDLLEDIIARITEEIVRLRTRQTSLDSEHAVDVDRHDDSSSENKKRLATMRRIRTELEDLI